jgi:hypothetical protein
MKGPQPHAQSEVDSGDQGRLIPLQAGPGRRPQTGFEVGFQHGDVVRLRHVVHLLRQLLQPVTIHRQLAFWCLVLQLRWGYGQRKP